MSTLIRSDEAAELLNVSKATLYAYVSRGRLTRSTAADGRTSLFARAEVERLAERSRRANSGPKPTIDVQIASAITTMSEDSLAFRGHDVAELVRNLNYEDVAELLWADDDHPVAVGHGWQPANQGDLDVLGAVRELPVSPIGKMAIAADVLDAGIQTTTRLAPGARRLLLVSPALLGSRRRRGPFADRLTRAWRRQPEPALVRAVDTALSLLADHELATSTLAVRIAASVRASPYIAIGAGLTSLEGTLHGSASATVHRFLALCAAAEPATVIASMRADRQPIPGFGHKVYRGVDPRFRPLLDAVERLDGDDSHISIVEAVIAEVGRTLPHQPNVDLALGALSWTAGLDPDVPIFAVARIAGFAAHYREELEERPLRFRGVARPIRQSAIGAEHARTDADTN